jgi:hypothetical protein
MPVLFHLLIGEIIRPPVFGMGWLLVIVATLGVVRPTKATFYKWPLVGLLGGYACLALPTIIAMTWRALIT